MAVLVPSGKRTTMNPPPPMLPAVGCVTPRAKPTATAASTALPPFFRISTPTSLAAPSALLTAPCVPIATPGSAAEAAVAGVPGCSGSGGVSGGALAGAALGLLAGSEGAPAGAGRWQAEAA